MHSPLSSPFSGSIGSSTSFSNTCPLERTGSSSSPTSGNTTSSFHQEPNFPREQQGGGGKSVGAGGGGMLDYGQYEDVGQGGNQDNDEKALRDLMKLTGVKNLG